MKTLKSKERASEWTLTHVETFPTRSSAGESRVDDSQVFRGAEVVKLFLENNLTRSVSHCPSVSDPVRHISLSTETQTKILKTGCISISQQAALPLWIRN